MEYKYEPLTRVIWLMEEHDYTQEEAERIAQHPVCITEIAEVFWKTEGGDLCPKPDYCFRTKEDIFIDEAEWATDAFLLQYYDNEYHVLALSDEDFYTSDDVTDQFDVNAIIKACQAEEKDRAGTDDPVENRIEEYEEFTRRMEDEDSEDEDYECSDDEPFYVNIDL